MLLLDVTVFLSLFAFGGSGEGADKDSDCVERCKQGRYEICELLMSSTCREAQKG